MRLLALVAVRDGMRFLPGFVANVSPQVDGIVALDDGSTDGSGDYLAVQKEVLEVLRSPPERGEWDEVGSHKRLVQAALRHGAEWILCLDADERVEHEFRERAERVIRRGRLLGISAFTLPLRELWDDPGMYRVDGIWGKKGVQRLFRARSDHVFDETPQHGTKAPLQARWLGRYPMADLPLYHLGMLTPADRVARRRRYELADPEGRWQAVGYGYLTDERGLRLERVPPGRGYSSS